MAFLDEVGKTIGKASQGISDAAKTIGDAAKETRENIARERQAKVTEAENKKIVEHEKAAEEARKCPFCGESLKAFQTICPACGHEIVNAKTSTAILDFSRELREIEAKRKPESKIGNLARSIGVAKADTTDEQLANLIRNVNIPNNKEDVYEFIIMASNNINTAAVFTNNPLRAGVKTEKQLNGIKLRNEAWISKMKQIYERASLSFADDADFERIRELYNRTNASIDVKGFNKIKQKDAFKTYLLLAGLILILIILMMSLGSGHRKKEAQLEALMQEIQIDIENQDYDAALIKAQSLRMDDNYSSESTARWDEQREAIIKIIEEKKASEE